MPCSTTKPGRCAGCCGTASPELVIGPADPIILDDSSLNGLESKVARLAPATIYSRLLVARATTA